MTLAAGKRLGSYEILALIGVGGMGEVYKARDTRLDRTVAIKILPDHVAHDADFRQRFEREAKTISSLNHAHICTLYDVGSENGVDFLVMELLEGETLTQRLTKGALPFPQVLRYAIEIAEALDRAHRQGVTHRDLKPGNVMITKSGAKLLDFGLAKLKPASPVQLSGPAATAARDPLTASGTILGTLQYMAPEQVEGTAADHRSDIFAFGAIVYEMATGKNAFEGASQASLIGAILKDDPRPVSTLQPLSPPGFDALIATCLAKDPDERWQSAGDVARQLRLLQSGSSHPAQPAVAAAVAAGGRASHRLWSPGFGTLALGVALAAAVYYVLRPSPSTPRPVIRIGAPVAVRGNAATVSMSADGRRVAFLSADSALVQVRDLDQFDSRGMPGTEGVSSAPCFSPDGQWIAYSAAGNTELKKMPITGGVALTLVEGGLSVDYCDWGDDGYVYFSTLFGISRVPEAGGDVESVVEPDAARGEQSVERPQLLPGGRRLLVSALTASGLDDIHAVVVDLDTRERKTVIRTGAGFASYAATDSSLGQEYLIYATGGAVFAAPFDSTDLTAGAAQPVAMTIAGVGVGVSASRTGTIAYLGSEGEVSVVEDAELAWVGRDGVELRLPEPPHAYAEVELSPDGRHASVNVFDVETLTIDLWLYDLDSERLTRLTFGGANLGAVWTPDGRRVIYASADSVATFLTGQRSVEVRHLPADQSAAPALLLGASDREFLPTSITRDGTVLAGTQGPTGARDISVLILGDAAFAGGDVGQPRAFLDTRFDESDAIFSPDGRYLAYVSNESGREEIYVVPYPGPGGKVQISRNGGRAPRWNPTGGELFYLGTENDLMVVDVDTAGALRASAPRRLFSMPPFWAAGRSYDVAPDGARFLVRRRSATTVQLAELRIVVNWAEDFERGTTGAGL